jgi:repressor LexA
MELTPRQADVLLLIRNHRHLHGYAPSIREIATALGISRATTMAHIDRLEKKNFLRRTPMQHRTLEVVEDSQGVLQGKKPSKPPKPKLSKLEETQARLDALRNAG